MMTDNVLVDLLVLTVSANEANETTKGERWAVVVLHGTGRPVAW